jgi:hypothetical protein
MEDFLVPLSFMTAGGAIGSVLTLAFGGTIWIGALIGAAIPFVFFLGFYLAVYAFIAGFAELIGGGK